MCVCVRVRVCVCVCVFVCVRERERERERKCKIFGLKKNSEWKRNRWKQTKSKKSKYENSGKNVCVSESIYVSLSHTLLLSLSLSFSVRERRVVNGVEKESEWKRQMERVEKSKHGNKWNKKIYIYIYIYIYI